MNQSIRSFRPGDSQNYFDFGFQGIRSLRDISMQDVRYMHVKFDTSKFVDLASRIACVRAFQNSHASLLPTADSMNSVQFIVSAIHIYLFLDQDFSIESVRFASMYCDVVGKFKYG